MASIGVKTQHKPSGRTYRYWYEEIWNPLRKKPKHRYLGSAVPFGAHRLFAGGVAFVVNAMRGEIPWHVSGDTINCPPDDMRN